MQPTVCVGVIWLSLCRRVGTETWSTGAKMSIHWLPLLPWANQLLFASDPEIAHCLLASIKLPPANQLAYKEVKSQICHSAGHWHLSVHLSASFSFFFLRGRESRSRGGDRGAEREGEGIRESQAGSMFSAELHDSFDLPSLRSWPEPKSNRSLKWRSHPGAPLICPLLKRLKQQIWIFLSDIFEKIISLNCHHEETRLSPSCPMSPTYIQARAHLNLSWSQTVPVLHSRQENS